MGPIHSGAKYTETNSITIDLVYPNLIANSYFDIWSTPVELDTWQRELSGTGTLSMGAISEYGTNSALLTTIMAGDNVTIRTGWVPIVSNNSTTLIYNVWNVSNNNTACMNLILSNADSGIITNKEVFSTAMADFVETSLNYDNLTNTVSFKLEFLIEDALGALFVDYVELRRQ